MNKLVEKAAQLDDVCRGVTSLLTDRMVGEAFEKNLERICSLLETGNASWIGVHGMGGAGKTTLAKHIHNRLLEQSQEHVFWITVSQEFSIKGLQDKIARFLGVELLDMDEESIRAARLNVALSKMKPVLIFDDVWDKIDLVKLGGLFSVESCRLIITSRSLQVCQEMLCQEVITVKNLDEDEAWELFNETLGNEIKLGTRVEQIAKSMVKLCYGLPLGIVVLAVRMMGVTDEYTWESALAELKRSAVGKDSMGKVVEVLKYSFDRLNIHEQLCFLYCTLYPADEEIRRVDLVQSLISEGLMTEMRSSRAQVNLGHVVLDKLVNNCLLETNCFGDRDGWVKMHNLVREMTLHITKGKYMVRVGEMSLMEISMEEEWRNDIEKVSLMHNNISRIREGISPNCPSLSTLLLQGNFDLGVIPNSFFSKMQGLCTLNLCGTRIIVLPESISDLTSLKALLLKGCNMLEYVPNLGKLRALRELNLDYTAITEVPEGLEELSFLVFLSIYGRTCLKVLPRGLFVKLVRLQCVRLPLHLEVEIEEIVNLRELEEFWGRVKNVADVIRFITMRPSQGHDTLYRIQVGPGSLDQEAYYGDCDKVVSLSGCNLEDKKILGLHMEWLRMRKCEGLSSCLLDGLNNPTSLKVLKVDRCGGIECLLKSDEQELGYQISTLEDIDLGWLKDFKWLIGKGDNVFVFSSLTRLVISKCNKMRNLGLPVQGFPNLLDIKIRHCEEMEEIFEDEGRGSLTLPKLRWLTLSKLPRLKSLCKAAIICNSIDIISIKECPRLMKKLPLQLDVPPPTTLTHILVEREWWEALEWDNPNLPSLLQSFVEFHSNE